MAVRSDSLGRYSISAPRAGRYHLRFTRQGLAPFEVAEAVLRDGADTVIDVTLTTSVTTLATVSVVGERDVRAPPGRPGKYDEFLRRKSLGMGTFLTREDLESRPRHQMQDIFNGIPGIKVRHNGTAWTLQSQRCSGKTIPGLDPVDKSRKPMFFLDGIQLYDIDALSLISPSEVEAVEVYQGGAQVPAEALGNSCFAIFVWLRSM